MKRWKVLLGILMLSLFVAGCGDKEEEFSADKDTIYVKEDGTIQEIAFDTLNKEYYNNEEMESFVNQEVRDYNLRKVEEIIKVEKVELEDGVACAYLTYTRGNAYAEFNNVKFYSGTIKGAMNGEYEFNDTFLNYEDGTEVALAQAVLNSEEKIIIYEPDTDSNIRVDGKIEYISSNVTKIDDKNVAVKEKQLSYIIYKNK